jgi:hypothetical protein
LPKDETLVGLLLAAPTTIIFNYQLSGADRGHDNAAWVVVTDASTSESSTTSVHDSTSFNFQHAHAARWIVANELVLINSSKLTPHELGKIHAAMLAASVTRKEQSK